MMEAVELEKQKHNSSMETLARVAKLEVLLNLPNHSVVHILCSVVGQAG